MYALSETGRFRRRGAGLCMIAAPPVLLLGALLHPDSGDSAAARVAAIAEDPGRNYAAHTASLVGLALFLGVVLELVRLAGERAPAFANVGGVLAIVGLFGATAIVAVDGIAFSQIGQPNANAQEMAALLERIMESAGARAIAVVGALSFLSGMLVLASGLWRAHVARPWLAPGLAVAAIAFFLGQVADNRFVFAIAFAVYLVVLWPLGLTLLKRSN